MCKSESTNRNVDRELLFWSSWQSKLFTIFKFMWMLRKTSCSQVLQFCNEHFSKKILHLLIVQVSPISSLISSLFLACNTQFSIDSTYRFVRNDSRKYLELIIGNWCFYFSIVVYFLLFCLFDHYSYNKNSVLCQRRL